MNVIEFRDRIEVISEPDVLVVGGGPAGVGAALAAARLGMAVVVVEQTNALGGIATSGLHGHICLYSSWANKGERVVGGVADELARGTVARGFGAYDEASFDFEVEGLKLVLEEVTAAAGITPYYYTQFSDVVMDNGRIQAVIVQCKNGRVAFAPRVVIDCTGDADVAVRAGVRFEKGRPQDGAMQPMTLMFQLGGVDYNRVREFREHGYRERYGADDAYNMRALWAEAQANGDMEPFQDRIMGWWWTPTRPDQLGINFTHIVGADPTRVEDLTRATIEGRRQAYHTAEVYRRYVPGMEHAWVSHCAALVGTRESRRIDGLYRITEEDLMAEREFPDSIGYGSFFIDIHNCTGPGMDGETWRPHKGFKYQIPYRALVPKGVGNLLVAGRCISSTHKALGSLRVMPQCILEGEAAGTAAALALRQGSTPADVDGAALQAQLRSQGAIVSAADIPR